VEDEQKQIILVGTSHLSKNDVETVERIILKEAPDTVCVELCESRYSSIKNEIDWGSAGIWEILKSGMIYLLVYRIAFSFFEDKIGKDSDVHLGEEKIKAIETAESIDANVRFVDRDIRVSFARFWDKMSIWNKIKFLWQYFHLFFVAKKLEDETVRGLKENGTLESYYFGMELPQIKEVLTQERDAIMAKNILQASGEKIVAVVGKGHVDGINKHMAEKTSIEEFLEVPESKLKKIFGLIISLLFVFAVVFCLLADKLFDFAIFDRGSDVVVLWFIVNMAIAPIGALLARAHPLSIITASIAAPFASMIPVFGAGLAAIAVEWKIKKLRVIDFEGLYRNLVDKRFFQNRLIKAAMIFIFTTICINIADFIVYPYLLKKIIF